jgi:hypothetical protein
MAAPVRGSMDPSESELQERRVRLAKGESPAAIARDYGRSPSALYNQKANEKALIASIREAGLEAAAARAHVNWIIDVAKSTQVFEADVDRLHELSYDPELQPKDVSRYLRDATHITTRAHELNGLIKQRLQADVVSTGRASIEIVGVDLDAVTEKWEEAAEQGSQTAPESAPDTAPEPAPVLGPIPEKFLGREGAQQAQERRAAGSESESEPEFPVPDRDELIRVLGGR